jgi:murein DD-endopeptidase MepM/ murein hydrolase activator NlpD
VLEWPTSGRLRSGFGTVVHPEFKTKVPHPGWDIEAEFGAEIVSIFDGRVVFADWMRGYGLTAIVDHGGGLLSIYAHASVLVVERGARVSRRQQLGSVGDTGSLSGPFLYFEMRVDGEPTDPEPWLLRR